MKEKGDKRIIRISKPAKFPMPVQDWDRKFLPASQPTS